MFDLRDSRPSLADRIAVRAASWSWLRSPFGVLSRTFFAQFFTSELVTSNIRFHQATIGVFTFLLMPGLMMMAQGLSVLNKVEFRARQLHTAANFEPSFAGLAAVLITYSMVTVSFVAVIEWNALGFDRRDAMVLGPMPIKGSSVIGAKLVALGAFLVATAALVNVMPTISFAMSTAALLGPFAFVRYLAAYILATMGAAVFVFAAIVTARGIIERVAGARLAMRFGGLVQFLFVGTFVTTFLLVVTAENPEAKMRALFASAGAAWSPTDWFLSLFESVRGSTASGVHAGAGRAVMAAMVALGGAALVSVAGFKRQTQLALAPSPSVGAFASVRIGRAFAGLITGRDPIARATVQFMLLTLARCRAQQELVAINLALGGALVIAGLARGATDWTVLTHPRTALLWAPFVVAYVLTLGLRAAFYVPSELRGAWTFQINSVAPGRSYWSATRASMIAVVLPPVALLTAGILVPLAGWSMAWKLTLFTCSIVVLLIELAALTVDFVPFTRAYPPGHANLKSLWWMYLLGVVVFAYWPARLELWAIAADAPLFRVTGLIALAVTVLDIAGRFSGSREPMPEQVDETDDLDGAIVLDISAVRH